MTLYELTGEQIRLMDILADPDIDAEDLQDTIDMVEENFRDKADAYGQVYTQLMADAEMLNDEIERLTAFRKAKENGAKRLKDAMLRAMLLTGQSKVEGHMYAFTTRKSKKLEITGEVPEDFLRYKDPEPDKKMITDWIKKGHEVSWAHLEENTSLIVR